LRLRQHLTVGPLQAKRLLQVVVAEEILPADWVVQQAVVVTVELDLPARQPQQHPQLDLVEVQLESVQLLTQHVLVKMVLAE
jgi:hypothetical protein